MYILKNTFLNITYATLDHVPPFFWNLLHVITDIIYFWYYKLVNYLRPKSRTVYYEAIQKLDICESYEQWQKTASMVDDITGANLWRRNFFSRRYDFNSVLEQYSILVKAIENNQFDIIKEKCSTTGPCMLRNFAGIADKRLFTKSLLGTKLLIEQYLERTVQGLNILNEQTLTPTSFYQRCKFSLGTTALVLQGGSLFGLFHLGVIKGLLSQGLLPNIISASSMGACVAAVFGCLSNEEMSELLQDDGILNIIKDDPELLKLCGYGMVEQHLNLGTLIQNLIHHGYSQDVYLFMQFVLKYVVKDITFEEAYQKTHKIFNVVIHPTDTSCPNLLNYVTTPNVLIRSAVMCSLGSDIVSNDTTLLCKNLDNDIVPFLTIEKFKHIKFLAPENSINPTPNDNDNPYTRLTELFNVNNFVVSLARPYLAPFVVNDLKHEIKTSKYYYYKNYPDTKNNLLETLPDIGISQINFIEMEPLAFKFKYHLERKLKNILTMEFYHRMQVLDNLGLLSSWVKRLIIDERTPRSAVEIAIVPNIKSLSLTRIVEGQLDNIKFWINSGERSTWPILPLIKTRCSVEFKLDEIIKDRKAKQ